MRRRSLGVHSWFSAFLLNILLLSLTTGASPLAAQQAGATLHGAVILPSGSPMPQASVTLEGSAGGQAATTSADGQYKMAGLNPGTYKLTISSPDFQSYVVTVSLGAGDDKEMDAVLFPAPKPQPVAEAPAATGNAAPEQPTVQTAPAQTNVVLQKGSSALTGAVTDPSGAFIPGATVTLTGPSGTKTATSNERGTYSFTGLAPGPYKLKVTAQNFAAFETDVTLPRTSLSKFLPVSRRPAPKKKSMLRQAALPRWKRAPHTSKARSPKKKSSRPD